MSHKMSGKQFGSGSGKMSGKSMANSTTNNSMTQRTPGGTKVGSGTAKPSNTLTSTPPKKIS